MSSTDQTEEKRRSSSPLGTDSNQTSPSSSRPSSLPPTPPSGTESIHTEKILLAAPIQPFLTPVPPASTESNERAPLPCAIPRSRSLSRMTTDAGKAVASTTASGGDEKEEGGSDETGTESPNVADPIEELLKADIPPLPTPRPPSSCPIFCCFYAEFDNVVGPKVAYQSPHGFMDQDTGISADEIHEMLGATFQRVQTENYRKSVGISEESAEEKSDDDKSDYVEKGGAMEDDSQDASLSIFDATSEYIITGNELAGKMINLSTHNMHILTRPTAISDARYERNALLFSVGFVLSRTEDPRPFRPLLSKWADVLRSMEVEHHFLTDPNKRVKLQPMLDRLLVSLNSAKWECNLLLDPANALNLRAFRPSKPPASPVPDYAVPILVREDLLSLYDWDLAIQWISMFLSGVDHAKLIATKSDVDMEMVRACLRVLKHHGVIALVDMFFYSNRYEFTDRASAMMAGKEPMLLQEAMDYVTHLHQRSNSNTPPLGEAAPGSYLSSSVGRHSDKPFLPMNEDVMSFPPRKASMETAHVGSMQSARELPKLHISRRHQKKLKQALAELYCSCNRTTSFGDMMISKLSESSSSFVVKRGSSKFSSCDGVELEGIQESMGADTIIRLSSAESERGRSLLFPSESSNLDLAKKGIDQSRTDWTEVFEFIDHRRFATFGVVHGLLRRVHCYPRAIESSGAKEVTEQPEQLSLKESENSNKQRHISRQGSGQPSTVIASGVAAMMDGTKCDDELACEFEKPIDELIEIVEASGKRQVVSIYSIS